MSKWALALSLLLLSSCSHFSQIKKSGKIKVFHYNIKELDSKKLRNRTHPQVQAVAEVLKNYEFDLLSINEIQYDLPGVPTPLYQTRGENMALLLENTGYKRDDFHISFYPANTGKKAKQKKSGQYVEDFTDKEAQKLADQESFGIYPAQYSTGLASKFKIVRTFQTNDIRWTEFNPKRDPSQFTDAFGKPLRKDMPLFDKNFTDTVIDVEGRQIHIITFHTVPAFHFGNKKTPNYERNADQLRFLEWYLTGNTDIKVHLPNIAPLLERELFIAMGDFNTDFKDTKNSGSTVIRRMQANLASVFPDEPYSYESDGFAPNPFSLRLDYIFYRGLKIADSEMITPKSERLFLSCDHTIPEKIQGKLPKNREIVSYFNKEKGTQCFDTVDKFYATLKNASDHFPFWVGFDFE